MLPSSYGFGGGGVVQPGFNTF